MSDAASVDARRRRLFLGLTLAIGSAVLAFIAFGDMGENLVYFWEPTQLVEAGDDAYGAQIRLGGLVKEGSLDWDEASQELRMVVTDGAHEVKVHATGAPPQMLREGIGVVVEGTMVKGGSAGGPAGGTFETDRLMVKHSNEYRAPQEGVDPKELYKTLEENVN
ncbi:MAG: cytochrome c maturation protein CcmE [Alphaproteobacteria bacterium]|nr:cytochrome c maturation protein CcmE [Alphaproteobacteria bacterium]